jgi:alpha-glucosidase
MPDAWWREAVIYQIYPRSFQDTNGDGVGDLTGVRSRLGYLEWLGVDAVWLSPIYPSPMADFGYDVRDYRDVDPSFGSLMDLRLLVDEAHERGMKIILDFVPNHTSDQHSWFRASRSSRTSDKRDWYVWRDAGPGGGPPNNWRSNFGGPAWALDPASGQYYYHAFLPEQPDLNWRNPAVRREMLEILRFWLELGVDGFRVDALSALFEDEALRDNPTNLAWTPDLPDHRRLVPLHTADLAETLEATADMRAMLDRYPDRVLIGELYLPIDKLVLYYGPDGSAAHLPFNFHLILTQWNAKSIVALIAEYEAALPAGAWPNWVLSNHDQKRVAARVGPDQARLAAMLLLTLRGTPTIYYADEIGTPLVSIPSEAVRDPLELREPGEGRDSARTPMAWNNSAYAGFGDVEPWLPLHADWLTRNVGSMSADPLSILTLHRRLIALRRSHAALRAGAYRLIGIEGDCVGFERVLGAERLIVALNFGDAPAQFGLAPRGSKVLLSSYLDRDGVEGDVVALRPAEGLVLAP